ncbi:hypothetical protein Lepto7375DRAFT_0620 [Leptolyngbya sp. PCC 7375]|nr:hypothetical protein Lepto7375DRAFT_0620 [Leptolyngbya sp. PCC 7375]
MRVYLLWEQNRHVDLDGNVDEPTLHGVFSSVEAMHYHMVGRYFDFQADPRGINLTEPMSSVDLNRRSEKGYDYGCYCSIWYEERELDETDENYVIDGEVVIRGDPHNKASP